MVPCIIDWVHNLRKLINLLRLVATELKSTVKSGIERNATFPKLIDHMVVVICKFLAQQPTLIYYTPEA